MVRSERKYLNQYALYDTWTYEGDKLIKTEMAYPKGIQTINIKDMSEKAQLFESIKTYFEKFEQAHNGTSKASQREARKYIGEIKKLVTGYRKASVEDL